MKNNQLLILLFISLLIFSCENSGENNEENTSPASTKVKTKTKAKPIANANFNATIDLSLNTFMLHSNGNQFMTIYSARHNSVCTTNILDTLFVGEALHVSKIFIDGGVKKTRISKNGQIPTTYKKHKLADLQNVNAGAFLAYLNDGGEGELNLAIGESDTRDNGHLFGGGVIIDYMDAYLKIEENKDDTKTLYMYAETKGEKNVNSCVISNSSTFFYNMNADHCVKKCLE